ncbi:MAG: hypothetical protein JWO33_2203 [Caulobacteraceae bacterium]|nr:hypothetical protein [Caulobacteraceae bacterium]
MNYEHVSQPLAPPRVFYARLAGNAVASGAIIAVSMAIGMAGYHGFEHLNWIDAFANAAMILSGMGPLAQLTTTGGKIFAGLYALYSGLILIAAASLLMAPVLHRFLHRLHIADTDEGQA